MTHSLFRKLLQRSRYTKARDRRPHRSSAPFYPRVEGLEERWVLATVHWINPAAGVWSDPANWSTGAVPGPDDDVVLDAPGNATVIHAAGDDAVQSLAGANALVLSGGSLTLAAASTLDGELDLVGGTLVTGGRLTVNGSLLWTRGTMVSTGQTVADVTVANGGLDITGPDPKLLINGILDNAQTGTLSGSPLTLQGAVFENLSTATLEVWGSGVETNDMPLGNHSGFGNDGWMLVSDGTGFGGDFSNDGVVEVISGGLGAGGPREVFANTGTIELAGGNLWTTDDYFDDQGTITGTGNVAVNCIEVANIAGPITVTGDVSITAAHAGFRGPGFVVGGTLTVNAFDIGIGNTTVHAGAITLITADFGAGIGNSDLSADSNFSVSNSEPVFPAPFDFFNSTVESSTFTNGHGDAYFEGSALTADSLVNEGYLAFDSASSFTIRDITNTGQGYLVIAGSVSGNLVNAGELAIGTLGIGQPDIGIGQLIVGGDFTQTSTGRLDLNIMDAGQYSRLNVGGTASLDGTLSVSALPNTLMEGDSLQAIAFAASVGNFARYAMPDLGAGLVLGAVLGDDGLILVVQRQG